MNEGQLAQRDLLKKVIGRFSLGIPALMLLFFLPAGTLAYWQGWAYIAALYVPMVFVLGYLLKHAPDLLERRMRAREKEAEQRLIVKLFSFSQILMLALPGLDRRWGWSHVSLWVCLMGLAAVMLGYGWVFLVFRENRYAARVVEVDEGQKVISSGPYALVRHPMYTGVLVMMLATPLALGSWWALLPALTCIPALMVRIGNEEQVLVRDLAGYEDYRRKVRSRLIPGVW